MYTLPNTHSSFGGAPDWKGFTHLLEKLELYTIEYKTYRLFLGAALANSVLKGSMHEDKGRGDHEYSGDAS